MLLKRRVGMIKQKKKTNGPDIRSNLEVTVIRSWLHTIVCKARRTSVLQSLQPCHVFSCNLQFYSSTTLQLPNKSNLIPHNLITLSMLCNVLAENVCLCVRAHAQHTNTAADLVPGFIRAHSSRPLQCVRLRPTVMRFYSPTSLKSPGG